MNLAHLTNMALPHYPLAVDIQKCNITLGFYQRQLNHMCRSFIQKDQGACALYLLMYDRVITFCSKSKSSEKLRYF